MWRGDTVPVYIDNISACLACLRELGVSVDGVQAEDVRHGNLKAILGVFFSLSRHKQQQKHLTRQSEAMPRIPSAISKHGMNTTSIPLPAGSRLSGIEDGRQSSIPSGSVHQQLQGTVNWKWSKETSDRLYI
ncbi:hypothetical protein Cfor_12322 [Coptotermes formosanus]|uniref:Calponin-homology (CH) domain-containing protein n=1 Tax=Coptotermes formosanus TaxID=36987 RepID=A0A6L2PKS6_COPFO|nr:hypothetical protein Cfor_12322 [Coptotermes formosanus]